MLIPTSDKWQWLEAQEAPECLKWVDKQNRATEVFLDALPNASRLKERLQELAVNDARCPDYWNVGHLFRLRKTDGNQEGVLEIARKVADGTYGEWRIVIDIDELGRKEKKSFSFHTIDMPSCVLNVQSSRLLLLLSVGGADTVELREIDIEKGVVVEEGGFRTGEGRISAAWLDKDHILINHALDGGPVTGAGWPLSTYIWKRHTSLENAKLGYQAEYTDSIIVSASLGVVAQRKGHIWRAIDYSTIVHYIISLDGSIEELSLPRKTALCYPWPKTSEHVIACVLEETELCGTKVPAGTVVACTVAPGVPADQRLSIVYIPEEGEVNAHLMQGGLTATQSRVCMCLTKRGVENIVVFERREDSWICVQRKPIEIGSHCVATAGGPEGDSLILKNSGLLKPATIWLDSPDGNQQVLYEQTALIDEGSYTIAKDVACSTDGTEVDYIVLYPKVASQATRDLRVLMTAYGAFGVSFPIEYLTSAIGGISMIPWLESGGALAIALIRGGGERGGEWHQAARQEKRQNSYDDFAAVTQKLIADGFTSPGRIGVFGSSNGGLLAAVMGTQRPELYGAIVSDVPLADMLRYPYIAMGAAWVYEYGDPKDPEMARILQSYSPYHNIVHGVRYPAFLVTVSTRDDRVGSGHARKLVAKLQEGQPSDHFLFEDREGGHGVSDSFKNIPLMSRRVAFFMRHIK